VARAAQLARHGGRPDVWSFIGEVANEIHGDKLRTRLLSAAAALASEMSCLEFAEAQGWKCGVSGYVNHTPPAALYCWARSPGDFRQCVESAVMLGGDTDSVAAITGAICGANLGHEAPSPQNGSIVLWSGPERLSGWSNWHWS
jgi:ADP-ribosylglycohydrolase